MHGSYQLSVKIQTPRTQSQLELKIRRDLVDKHAYCAPLNRSPPDFEISSTITHLFFFYYKSCKHLWSRFGSELGRIVCTAAHLEMGSQLRCLNIWFEYKNKSQTGLNNTLVMSCSVHCLFSVNINNIFTDLFSRMPVFKQCYIYYFGQNRIL